LVVVFVLCARQGRCSIQSLAKRVCIEIRKKHCVRDSGCVYAVIGSLHNAFFVASRTSLYESCHPIGLQFFFLVRGVTCLNPIKQAPQKPAQ